jgi:hypothetical protein
MYRLYKITKKEDGTDNAQRDDFDDVIVAEGSFEFQKGLAMETGTFTFLMLLNNIGEIHNNYIATIGEGTISPRLFEVKVTDEETPKSYAHDTAEEVSADFWKRLGGAKQDASVKAEMLRGVDANGTPLKYTYWVRPIEVTEETA